MARQKKEGRENDDEGAGHERDRLETGGERARRCTRDAACPGRRGTARGRDGYDPCCTCAAVDARNQTHQGTDRRGSERTRRNEAKGQGAIQVRRQPPRRDRCPARCAGRQDQHRRMRCTRSGAAPCRRTMAKAASRKRLTERPRQRPFSFRGPSAGPGVLRSLPARLASSSARTTGASSSDSFDLLK